MHTRIETGKLLVEIRVFGCLLILAMARRRPLFADFGDHGRRCLDKTSKSEMVEFRKHIYSPFGNHNSAKIPGPIGALNSYAIRKKKIFSKN